MSAGQRQGSQAVPDWEAPVRALVLDIDDTLVNTQAAMREACRRGAEAAWPQRSGEVHQGISDVFYDDPGGHFDAYTRGETDFPTMREARYVRACQELGLSPVGFEVFEAAYREAFTHEQEMFDDVPPLLAAAEAAGVPVCFVTNSGDAQTEMKLRVTGLAGRGEVVTTDTLGVGKPDPRIFEEARRRTGIDLVGAVCVGDTLGTDVIGGRLAGMRVAWLQRTDTPEPRNAGWDYPAPDTGVRIVHSLHEVASLLPPASKAT